MQTNTPPQLAAMQAITGTSWAPGDGANSDIAAWLKFIAMDYPITSSYCRSVIHEDYFEWCGLTVGYCIAKSGIQPVFGAQDTDRFLWALAWQEWGDMVQTPLPGDVVVFDFGGGHHHVTLFESDNGNGYWACRGGNQSNQVKASNFPKSRVHSIQRPSIRVPPASPALSASVFKGDGSPLTQKILSTVAEKLGCGVAEIWAIAFTETDPPYGGCNADKRPQILFERHIFHKLTGGRFDSLNPNISNPTLGGYGPGGAHQYDRLSLAMSLDESAALQSASWGIGQVLGENYREAGWGSPQDLVRQAFASEDQQLLAVANEIIADGADRALATHDWRTFARIYNGPNYAKNNYDSTIRTWYEKLNSGASPDLKVRSAQVYLMYLGFEPSDIDGIFGKRTRSAMNEYQSRNHLPITDELDDTTFASIEANGKAVQGKELAASG